MLSWFFLSYLPISAPPFLYHTYITFFQKSTKKDERKVAIQLIFFIHCIRRKTHYLEAIYSQTTIVQRNKSRNRNLSSVKRRNIRRKTQKPYRRNKRNMGKSQHNLALYRQKKKWQSAEQAAMTAPMALWWSNTNRKKKM